MNEPKSDIQPLIDRMQDELIDRVWVLLSVVACLAIPVSMVRMTLTGWQPVYILHGILLTLFLVITALRKRLSRRLKTVAMAASLMSLGAAGVLSFGLMSSGVWYMVLSIIITGVVLSKRGASLLFVLSSVALLGVMFAFYFGMVELSFDANMYHAKIVPWLIMIVSSMILPMLVLGQLGRYEQALIQALQEVERQRNLVSVQANYDELTGLASRRLARDRFEMSVRRLRRTGGVAAIFFIDLDGFKQVNDTYDHDMGDRVLMICAERLKNTLRGDDTICRYGGDEFLVIVDNMKHRDNAEHIAKKLIQALEAPIVLQEKTITISASIGIKHFTQEDDSFDALIRTSDKAMYQAKHQGRGRWVVHQG